MRDLTQDTNISTDLKIAAAHFIKERKYWKKKLSGEWEKSHFPCDYRKREKTLRHIDSRSFTISGDVYARMMKITKGSLPMFHMVLSAGVAALLAKYTNHRDIIIGTSIDRQDTKEDLVNTILPLRIQLKDPMTFKELLLEVKSTVKEAIENQNYPIETLATEMNLTSSANEFPLFDVAVILENIQDKGYIRHTQPSITYSFLRTGNLLKGVVEYDALLYESAAVERFIKHYILLLAKVLIDVNIKPGEIELLPEEEKEQLFLFNDTAAQYPQDKTLHELFSEQAEKTPENTAVLHGDEKLTYRQLNERTNRFAGILRENGVKPGSLVGILAERSPAVVMAILGVLKAGAAYLPIDPGYPGERKRFLLEDSKAVLLLTRRSLRRPGDQGPPEWEGKRVYIEDIDVNQGDASNLENIAAPSDPAYIIYTSGTTGKPKGVLIEHKGLVNYIWWAAENYVKKEKVNFPLYTSISFDLTVTSLFTPLITGNALVIYSGEYGELLIQKIVRDNQVGVVKLTPSHLHQLKDENIKESNIKRFILGGEMLTASITREIHDNFHGNIEIYNEYGPTEATVGCMIYQFDPRADNNRQSVPIGIPAANTQIHLLDKHLRPVPMGAVGEIYIAGDGLARGYLNRPELTAERFIDDPFVPGRHMYRTGDQSRFLPDGNIEFLGRIDQQVKIRGFRIELSEIESKLMEYYKPSFTTISPGDLNRIELENRTQCSRCLLPANYPGIQFDNHGVCSVCRQYENYSSEVQKYFKGKEDFNRYIKNYSKVSPEGYDCLLLFSGGKDSSYMLYQLVDMGYKVLTFTFDNGYISDNAFENIKRITSELGVENIIVKTEKMKQIFVESLKSNHNVCHGCWHVLNTLGAKVALEKGINIVVSGLSRGQIFKMELEEFFQNGIFNEEEIKKDRRSFRQAFHSKDNKFSSILGVELAGEEVENLHFVDFFRYFSTPVSEILGYLTGKGWIKPADTGLCSSNCIINDVGIYVHLKDEGYHFYAAPLSWDIRLGSISREEGIASLRVVDKSLQVSKMLKEIGYYDSPIKEAVVTDKTDENGNQCLVAYIVSEKKLAVSELREYLLVELPEYMVPAFFIQVEKIPLTPHGKIDKKALPTPGGDIDTGVQYKAPRSPLEKLLVKTWEEVLGVDKVGIEDDYFTLGGDSIKAIQLAARLQKHQLKLETRHLFQYPTIAALGGYIKEVKQSASQEIVTGEVKLTPSQQWFFHKKGTAQHHFNQAVVLYRPDGFKKETLEKVFNKLLQHHDALRLVFERADDGKVRQFNNGMVDHFPDLETWNLREEKDYKIIIEETCNRVQGSIDLGKGPLVKTGLFKTNEGDYLAMVIHHLVVDGVSWRILLEDITTAYRQVEKGQEPLLPLKSTSFKEWAEKLHDYSSSEGLLDELQYWGKLQEVPLPALPVDNLVEERKEADKGYLSMELSEEYTKNLLKDTSKAYNTEINDLLLAALGLAFKQWAGMDKILVAMEGHGREEIIDNVDITRTIGWFTSMFPVVIDVEQDSDMATVIKTIKEMSRKIPNKGIGYGILKYLTPKENKTGIPFELDPQISFNYLGQFDQDIKSDVFQIADISPGHSVDLYREMDYPMEIEALISDGRLKVSVSYCIKEFNETKISRLVYKYIDNLKQIINHCIGKEETELTASDLSSADFCQEEMDAVFNELEETFMIGG